MEASFRNVALSLMTVVGLLHHGIKTMIETKKPQKKKKWRREHIPLDQVLHEGHIFAHELPGVGKISHELDGDEDFLLDVDSAHDLHQVAFGVRQEGADLEI